MVQRYKFSDKYKNNGALNFLELHEKGENASLAGKKMFLNIRKYVVKHIGKFARLDISAYLCSRYPEYNLFTFKS